MPRMFTPFSRRFLAVLGAAFLCLVSGPAGAHLVPCGNGPAIIAHMEKTHGEDLAVWALDARGAMVQILVNRRSGSWTMLIAEPDGLTCLVHTGESWEPIPPSADLGDRS